MDSIIRKNKVRKYSKDFLQFGFISDLNDISRPLCLICVQTLSNESMKKGRLESHLKIKHPNHLTSNLKYFRSLKKKKVL